MKILLVDDEPMQLRLTRQLILDILPHSHVEVAGSAFAALGILASEAFDLLITDIKMPQTSGLEMIQQIRSGSKNQSIMVAVLSGYGEFTYAQTAIKYGAFSYLLKPVSRRDLEDLLTQAEEAMSAGGEEMPEEVRQAVVEHAFYKLFAQAPLSAEEKAVITKAAGEGEYYVLSQKCPDTHKVLAPLMVQAFPAGLSLNLTPKLHVYIFSSPGEGTLEKVREVLARFNGPLECGLSFPHTPVELYAAFLEATRAAESLFYYPEARVAQYNPAFRNEDRERQLMEALTQVLPLGDTADTRRAFAALAEYYRKTLLGKKDLELTLLHMIDEHLAGSVRYFANDKVFSNFHLHYIRVLENAASLRQIEDAILEFGNSLWLLSGKGGDPLYENCRLYIQNNLQDLTLPGMAADFSYNATYFSELFSKLFGKTLSEYLLDTRLDKARELIESTDLKIYQVAERVGFKSTAHFIKTFRERYGHSPKQYAMQVNRSKRSTA